MTPLNLLHDKTSYVLLNTFTVKVCRLETLLELNKIIVVEKPNCIKCRHYMITWDKQAPYGCRLYQIKTRVMPSEVVKKAGAGECQGFEAKASVTPVKKELKDL